MAKKGLTYEELIELAQANYCKGGDSIVECWDRSTFEEYVREFGPMTKTRAMAMMRTYREEDREWRALNGRW